MAFCLVASMAGCNDDEPQAGGTTPTPDPEPQPQPTITVDLLAESMSKAPAELLQSLENWKIKEPTTELGLETNWYKVEIDNEQMTLQTETFTRSILSLCVSQQEAEDQVVFFKELKKLVDENADYEFKSAVVGNYKPTGEVDKSTVYKDMAEAMAQLASPDMKDGFYKFGYTFQTYVLVVELNRGQANLTIRPTVFPDEWKWYPSFFGMDMTNFINDYYYSIKSSGVIPSMPPMPISILRGCDANGKEMNITLQCVGHDPISRVEATYQMKDATEFKAYWISEMESDKVAEKYGKFETAMAFPVSKDEQPTEFKSLEEAVKYVKETDLNSFDFVIVIFRTEAGWVVSPQIDDRGFALTITEMKQQEKAAYSALRINE